MLTTKYWLLIIINIPLVLAGVVASITSYKTTRITRRRYVFEIIFWLLVGIGLILVEPAYNTLVAHSLTDSPPMSIFDVVMLSAVLFCLVIIKNDRQKIDLLGKKLSRLHENIVLAEEERRWDRS